MVVSCMHPVIPQRAPLVKGPEGRVRWKEAVTGMMPRQIRHFQAIVEAHSFTEAAERCAISQSGISQSIMALEDELGVKLLTRHNRSFELTDAGRHFYRKSLVITADLQRLCKETVRIGRKDNAMLQLGCLSSYTGDEFTRAVALFAERYPSVALQVAEGNHEDLYEGLRTERMDLVLNDQRRAFSDQYENLVLARTPMAVEIAAYSPLAKLESVEIADLKNTPCILIASPALEAEERRYFHDAIGFPGEFRFARTLQEARVLVVAGRGFLPVEGPEDATPAAATRLLPVVRDGNPIFRTYCAFWKKDNSGYYVETFAELLQTIVSHKQNKSETPETQID